MTIDFVTIYPAENHEYGIVHVKFPYKHTFHAQCFPIDMYGMKRTAEAAARKFAERAQFAYIPLNQHAITAVPFYQTGIHFVMELTFKGDSTYLGNATEKEAAQKKAAEIAEEKDMVLILP